MHALAHSFRFGKIMAKVQVSDTGLAEYSVVITSGTVRFSTRVPKLDASASFVAAQVIDDLFCAVSEPAEYVRESMRGLEGRTALKAGKKAERIVAVAKKMGYDELEKAVDIARGRGLL